MTTTPEPYVQATRYEVSLFPEGAEPRRHFTITVEWRGSQSWAVLDGPYCLGKDGGWEYEPLPSNRDDEWLAAHRFDLDTAQQLAKQAAPHLVVNGRTALDTYRSDPPRHIGGNAEDCPACHGTNPDYPFICPGQPAA
ncbi:hypothetical protein PV728_48030 [Streptomyces europaeiscabiei]|uniref:hypothetical protein n=1 Tax=Streptomyces europaeiscabiei TaxID=146819 RepID=UPI0029AC3878|nr:hypothetical protein [Streptomyces europaeiscabiei]MDX3637800.1 hypothetical protein [Streptomyces europaeiscabiei]MDX3655612.1 hypothetical protein [Streptomyces europaeiscabiei]